MKNIILSGGRRVASARLGRSIAMSSLVAFAASERMALANSFEAGAIKPGEIYGLANDSRFTEGAFSLPLTQFAVGYKDPNDLGATLEMLAPEVEVPSRLFEWKKWSNAEEFYTEADDIRAIGADFKRVEYTGVDQTGKTFNKGLMMRVDLDQVVQRPGWQNVYVGKLLRRLMRNEIVRAKTLLSAASTNTAKTWDVNADPDQDVIAEAVTAGDAVGFQFNRVVYGHTAWSKRSLALRGNANSAKWASAAMTPEELQGLFGVDNVYVSKERAQTGANTKTQILGNLVLMYFAEAGTDQEDPSNIKRFVSPPTEVLDPSEFQRPAGGLAVNVYIQQISPKLVDIYVEHNSNLIMTSTSGVRQFTVS